MPGRSAISTSIGLPIALTVMNRAKLTTTIIAIENISRRALQRNVPIPFRFLPLTCS
jgi:hypothetical protein